MIFETDRFFLTSRITAESPTNVVDLGCGPGNLTATLALRWRCGGQKHPWWGSRIPRPWSLRRGPSFLPAADGVASNRDFTVADIASWRPEDTTDVIVSNAALQWVPSHRQLMVSWLAALRPGGWLGVQVPGNVGEPSHVIMRELAESAHWRDSLDGVLRHDDAVVEPAEYQELFLRAGARADVWETRYTKLLQGENPVRDWVRGTGLRPMLAALGPEDSKLFEHQYAALVAEAYPPGEFGAVFPYPADLYGGRKTMTGLLEFPQDWQRALVIVAHPDDPWYGMAAAVAEWIDVDRCRQTRQLRTGYPRGGWYCRTPAGRIRTVALHGTGERLRQGRSHGFGVP